MNAKNADISILSNFLAIFFKVFSILRNFTKYYLHAKFQINWTIQTEITEGTRICPSLVIPICEKPGLFRVKIFYTAKAELVRNERYYFDKGSFIIDSKPMNIFALFYQNSFLETKQVGSSALFHKKRLLTSK